MRHVVSDHIGDFAAIYDEDVELVSVSRSSSESLKELATQLFDQRKVLEVQWDQAAADADAPYRVLNRDIDEKYLPAIAEEVTMAGEILRELLGCDRIGVRVATLTEPMCPRFHADQVPCRMLMTIKGPSTEWIAANDVDEDLLADRTTDESPLRQGAEVRQLGEGYWSLMKGGAWQDEFVGVVHRSPHQRGERLVISFDPVF